MSFGEPRWEVLRSVLSDEDTADACFNASAIWETATRVSSDATLCSYGLIRRVHFASRYFRNFIRRDGLWSSVQGWAGSNLKLCSLCISVRSSGMAFHPAHRDREHTGGEGIRCVTALIPLGQIAQSNGGTYFVSTDGQRFTPPLMCGDVLVWDGDAIHGAGAVSPGEERKALIARWVPTDQVALLRSEYQPVMNSDGKFSLRAPEDAQTQRFVPLGMQAIQ